VTQIPFNRPHSSPLEMSYVAQAIQSCRLGGDGPFTKRAHAFFERRYGFRKVLLTSSCTDALELAALVAGIAPGDEVIVPAFTFVSSANAFALRGAKIVFADSEALNPNIDPAQIAQLITARTKAIVVVHYAGFCCDMRRIMRIADDAGVAVIEDAAQALDSAYHGKPAGTFGAMAAFSFHETKNITCGEGGLIVLNRKCDSRRAEIIWEKGTDRSAFLRGEVDRYGWVDVGSSFLPSELNAAFLCAQLQRIEEIQKRRRAIFERYDAILRQPLAEAGIGTPHVPGGCFGNGHAYYIVLPGRDARTALFRALQSAGIQTASHYSSLHRSRYFGARHDGRPLPHSDRYSDCLLRLPVYNGITNSQIDYVCETLLANLCARPVTGSIVGATSTRAA
jgi:dTDP-4-amino-4,6-dideoxygalactose transaminase